MATIRPGTDRDAEALTDLHLAVWEEAYAGLIPTETFVTRRRERADRLTRWRENLTTAENQTLVATGNQGRLLGFTSVGTGRHGPAETLPRLEVMALYVRAEVYGHGVGHALLEQAIGDAAAYLWVLEGNQRAVTFYQRHGFRFDGGVAEVEKIGRERRMVRGMSATDHRLRTP